MQKWKRFAKMYQMQILQVFVVIVSVILAFTVIIPQSKSLIRRFQLMKEAEVNIKNLKEKQVLLDSFESKVLEPTYRTVVATIPKEKILGPMMTGLDNLMSDYEITLISFTFDAVGAIGTESAKKGTKKESTLYSTIPITLMVEGTLSNIRNFLDSINRTRPLYLVKNFDLAFSPTEKLFRSKMFIDAFYMPLPKTLGSVASKLAPFTGEEQALLTKVSSFTELTNMSFIKVPSMESLPTSPMKSDPFMP